MNRLSRSQSVNNVARQRAFIGYEGYDEGQSNSAEARLTNGNRKSGQTRLPPLEKSESEQDFRAMSGNGNRQGNRSRIPTMYRHAGRTPAAQRNGGVEYDENGAAYDIYEMSQDDARVANGDTKSRGRSTKSINGRSRSLSNKARVEEEAEELMQRAEDQVVEQVMDETGVTSNPQ